MSAISMDDLQDYYAKLNHIIADPIIRIKRRIK